jgi:hypothetical protein
MKHASALQAILASDPARCGVLAMVYAAFIRDNPGWPGITFFRRRAEVALWPDRRDAATVRRFLAGNPASARARLALARVLDDS